MFGFGRRSKRVLSCDEVARWLESRARDVRTNSAEDARLYSSTANALDTESERHVALVNDFLAQ